MGHVPKKYFIFPWRIPVGFFPWDFPWAKKVLLSRLFYFFFPLPGHFGIANSCKEKLVGFPVVEIGGGGLAKIQLSKIENLLSQKGASLSL